MVKHAKPPIYPMGRMQNAPNHEIFCRATAVIDTSTRQTIDWTNPQAPQALKNASEIDDKVTIAPDYIRRKRMKENQERIEEKKRKLKKKTNYFFNFLYMTGKTSSNDLEPHSTYMEAG